MQKAKRNTCPGRFAGRTEGLGGTELSVVSREVVLHTQPDAAGYITAHSHKFGTGKLPIPWPTAAPSPSTSMNSRVLSPMRVPAEE
ncbi:hypothetical protein ACPCSQ_34220 [Streptomyces griseoincarnatus]|uniref:hypothetical protein n=1 Tax=Streptomyces sp. SMS_SU21 TaxID=2069440 RepID=UPI001CD9CB03|nr:hypothetical protein [Streptomyces sp. SMS_SU21]MCA2199587.1 hypothetical protein [Streptomyces sp. SMS_SU21]